MWPATSVISLAQFVISASYGSAVAVCIAAPQSDDGPLTLAEYEPHSAPFISAQFAPVLLAAVDGEDRTVVAHAKRLWRDYLPGATSPHDPRWPLYSGLVQRHS